MTTESIRKFPRLLWEWRAKVKELGLKFVVAWIILVGLYIAFDVRYMPWLAEKFGYFMVVPLYPSIFFACWIGVYVYDFFNQDVYFIERIGVWVQKPGKYKFTRKIKSWIAKNPKNTFFAIATWYSPLHAYLYFRGKQKNDFGKMVKKLAQGSLTCALFWWMVADVLILVWRSVRHLL